MTFVGNTCYSPGWSKDKTFWQDYPESKSRVVMCHGCFDILHLGHIRHLQQARSWGDRLIVSVTDDPLVNKGMGRPHFTAAQRVEALKALDCVDDAFVNSDPSPTLAIERIRPDIFVKGIDYASTDHPGHIADKAACDAVGTEFRVTTTEKWSSSRLINAEKYSDEVLQYLEKARKADFLPKILEAFEAADKLKIGFVGERIIDRYIYVKGLGKANKEYALATVETGEVEEFEGGAIAAAQHGEWKRAIPLVGGTGITKTRFIDKDFKRKLFEVYDKPSIQLTKGDRDFLFGDRFIKHIDDSHVVIVFDFGHGLLMRAERELLQTANFLALNSQSNAGNQGFNPVTLYGNADYICIDDPEARLAVAMPSEPIDYVVSKLAEKINCRKFLITHGKNGSFFYGDRYGSAPALSTRAVDTMGAGDAVLAVTAPLVAAGLDLEAAALVGNVVGAIKCSIVGHRRHVNRQEIVATLESLLK